MIIAGYLRQSVMKGKVDVVIPMDVMGLCYDYYIFHEGGYKLNCHNVVDCPHDD